MIKYAADAFLALKISYINEISHLAEKVGANITHVARGIGLDERIGTRFLQAGIGWGGSCLGKDSSALVATASEYGLDMPIVTAAREVNRRQRERVIEKLLTHLKILKGRTIGLLGLAFKPDTDDLRDAPAIDLARRLLARGARVIAHDPVAMNRFGAECADLNVSLCESPEDVVRKSDAVVLVTEWHQYQEIQWEALAAAMEHKRVIVLDGRQVLDEARLTRAGYHYLSIVDHTPMQDGFAKERDPLLQVSVPLESRDLDCGSQILLGARV
jgi:UDPglucose 6-dehydrogenase